MKVIRLKGNSKAYCCNAYLILGSWNRLEDVNTLVDIGADGYIIDEIGRISTGVGKRPVERVVLTHGHFDHAGGLAAVIDRYNPEVYAFAKIEGVDRVVSDGQILRMGDRDFEVLHTPGHSNDSICLYCAQERTLFSGDTPLKIRTPGGSYQEVFVKSLKKLAGRKIDIIYSGHDSPVTENAGEIIRNTLANVRKSLIIQKNL